MLIHSSIDDSTAGASELICFSLQAAVSQASRASRGVYAEDKRYEAVTPHHAPPLLPLRERDMKAMDDLFERQDADEIEADVNTNLHRLWPAPCWEDDLFDFLGDYL